MATAAAIGTTDSAQPVNARRLFLGSCMALVATSTAFGVVGASMVGLKNEFILTNAQVGFIGGAALWGFTISMVVFGPVVDSFGMKNLMRLAWLGHLIGTLTMILATGYYSLVAGAMIIAMANGLVEAACNPLVAVLYPKDKTVKLNQFHVWFPGGIALSGLLAFGLAQAGVTSWQIIIGLILIPTVLYGLIFMGQHFPETERVQSGYTTGQMWRATLLSPFFLLLLVMMAVTASMELGPNRWIPAVLESGGMPGILALSYISALMAVLRYRAGDVVHRLQPAGIIAAGAVLAALGLFWLSYAQSLVMVFAAATVFAVGVTYFWPTMLGIVAERNVQGGALALALMGGMGMAASGLLASPVMGEVADRYAHEQVPTAETVAVFDAAASEFPVMAQQAPGRQGDDLIAAAAAAEAVLVQYRTTGSLPEIETANALRSIISTHAAHATVERAAAILGPADNYGGRISFRYMAPFGLILLVVFGVMYIVDRRRSASPMTLDTMEQAAAEARTSI
jgi:MFS family permease